MLPTRKPNRLNGFDYSSNGAYFITICTQNRQNYFWDNVGAHSVRPWKSIHLTEYGKAVEKSILNISVYHPNVWVDNYVIMPNHIHIILFIGDSEMCDKSGRTMCAPTISLIVKQMKEYVTKNIGFSIWQKSFHDHIIRNKKSYEEISSYIDNNPITWEQDCFYINSQEES